MSGSEFARLPLAALFVAFFVAPLVLVAHLVFTARRRCAPDARPLRQVLHRSVQLLDPLGTLAARREGDAAVPRCSAIPSPGSASAPSARWQTVLLFLVILPIMTSVVVRTFSWIVILGRQGMLNQIAMGLGLTSEPLRLLFTELGVVIVLAQVQMPLMVLPILTVMSKIDPNLADASRALGAGEWRTLWSITLPLSLPGVIAGCILTYSASVTAFVTQTLIGGARLVYMPLHIYQQAIGANNWPFAAAISVIFMVAVLLVVAVCSTCSARWRAAYAKP